MNEDIRIKRLNIAFEKSGLSQKDICDRTGMSPSAISSYLSGRYFPKQKSLEMLSDVLNVSIPYLMGIDDKDDSNTIAANMIPVRAKEIPILGTICAGNGMYINEQYEGMLALDERIPASFCIRVKGDSMIGAGVNDGDIAIINKDFEYIEGNIYAVVLNGTDECTLKIVTTHDDLIVLTPSNPKYSVMTKDQSEVYIVGELVGIFRPCKKGLML